MGEPVTIREAPSGTQGFVSFETNRNLTGMGHEVFKSPDSVIGKSNADNLARRLFGCQGISEVHVYGQMITLKVDQTAAKEEISAAIEHFYTHY